MRRIANLAIAATAVALAGPSAHCQSAKSVMLLHGYFADGGTWEYFDWYLRNAFGAGVSVSRPAYGSMGNHEAAANEVGASFSSTSRPAVVAHSLGGTVARALDRSEMRVLDGIITVGSPHLGAGIAVNRFLVLPVISAAAANVLDAPLYYMGLDGGHVQDVSLYIEGFALLAAYALRGQHITNLLNSPIASELEPASPFLQTLNGDPNKAHELARMGQKRFAIVSHVPPDAQLCALLFPLGYDGCVDYINDLSFWFAGRALYYASYFDPNDPYALLKQAQAFRWWASGNALLGMNGLWCSLLGVQGQFGCDADGFIGAQSQVWPGAIERHLFQGPGHMGEPVDDRALAEASSILQQYFGVTYLPAPPPPPPPPPASPDPVVILGMQTGRPGDQCRWTAVVNAGNPPYSYEWRVDGQVSGTNDLDFLWTALSGSHAITVSVTGAGVPVGIASAYVFVGPQEQSCSFWY